MSATCMHILKSAAQCTACDCGWGVGPCQLLHPAHVPMPAATLQHVRWLARVVLHKSPVCLLITLFKRLNSAAVGWPMQSQRLRKERPLVCAETVVWGRPACRGDWLQTSPLKLSRNSTAVPW